MYAVHLKLIGKLLEHLLLVITKLFSKGVMADVLLAYIVGNLPFSRGWVTLVQNLRHKGTSSTNHLCTIR